MDHDFVPYPALWIIPVEAGLTIVLIVVWLPSAAA
jgi:hypothetical protein